MDEKIIKLNDKIFVHILDTNRFKSNIVAAFLLTDLNKEDVTANALIPAVLRRGTKNLKTMKDISEKMDNMYGAVFDASVDKIGDKQVLQFYISAIDNNFALNNEDLLNESLQFLCEAIYEPKLENGSFDSEYVLQEKETLRELIKGKINNKGTYAIFRCTEEMFGDDPYAIYKFGNEEDLENITSESLYTQYKKVLDTSEKHFYISGNINIDEVKKFFENKFETKESTEVKETKLKKCDLKKLEPRVIVDKMDVTQGKLVLGYDVNVESLENDFYKMTVYNAILGSSSNSKLFQNVREKASLAYTTRSIYVKHKGILLVTAGIELDKYEKALELIKIQVEDMKNGNFTDEDLNDAKVFLENLFVSCLDDQSTMIELSMGQYLLNAESDVYKIIEKIKNVTREDIIEMANKVELKVTYYLKDE